ncbi:MAG: hypothetical protein PHQ40_03960 [Anaerolineaceae bacterium]|nr:hypothetical protein [Anaerolineaceae bacterium]
MTERLNNRYWVSSYFKILAGLVIFIAIAGGGLMYLGTRSRLPSVLLKDKTCSPPCWYGVRPGQTNPDEAYAILENQGWVNKDTLTIEKPSDEVTEIYWKFMRPAGDSMGFIYFEAEHVSAITVLASGSLKMSQAIALLGTPEKMGAQVNQNYLDLVLLYPEKGYFMLVSQELPVGTADRSIEITEDTPVDWVSYFDPKMIEKLFTPFFLLDGLTEMKLSELKPWAGYGKISPPE